MVESAETSGSTVLADVIKVFTIEMKDVDLLTIAPVNSCVP